MVKELGIYISASSEMDAECELLGQLLADMVPSIRWTIKRTPASDRGDNPDIDVLGASQFYLLILGTDATAPIGVELQAAQRAGLAMFAFRNTEVVPSPSATYFIHNLGLSWQVYHTPQEFIRLAEKSLITRLIEGTPGYGLDLADIESLSARLDALEAAEPSQDADERRGAGRGGIILPKADA